MNPDLLKVLNESAGGLVETIRKNLSSTGTDATGKTSQSLRYEVKDNGQKITVQLVGRPFFATVETGRKPTPDKKPSRDMIENIKEWVTARGKDADLVWAIATSIQQKGTKLFQKGGRTDIYTDAISDPSFVDQISAEILGTFAKEYAKQIKLIFK